MRFCDDDFDKYLRIITNKTIQILYINKQCNQKIFTCYDNYFSNILTFLINVAGNVTFILVILGFKIKLNIKLLN